MSYYPVFMAGLIFFWAIFLQTIREYIPEIWIGAVTIGVIARKHEEHE